jgi:hypothetical protein
VSRDACGHRLCELIGGACSLAVGVSRGCGVGVPPRVEIDADVFEEIAGLIAVIDAAARPLSEAAREAAVRLAAIVRREAVDGRSVLAQARRGEPELVARLEALCARGQRGATTRLAPIKKR